MQSKEHSVLKQLMLCGKIEDKFFRKMNHLGLNVNLDYFPLKEKKKEAAKRELINTELKEKDDSRARVK